MQLVTFNNIKLHLQENSQHGHLFSNKEIALAYGVKTQTIHDHRNKLHSDELLEGVHWVKVRTQTAGGKQKIIHWTLEGAKMLGFFVKSPEAKHFRKWAAKLIAKLQKDYIVKTPEQFRELQDTIMAQNKLIANNSKPKTKPDDVFMNDSVLHNNFLEFLYQANKAVHEVNIIRHLSPRLDSTHQSLSNFMLHITRRYEKIRGVSQYKMKQIE